MNSTANSSPAQADEGGAPRVVDGRKRNFYIVDNPVVDQRIVLLPKRKRADAGWIYSLLCRKADNDTARAKAPLSYLTKMSGLSKPTILDRLKLLKAVALVKISVRKQGGKQLVNEYMLLEVTKLSEEELQKLQDRVNAIDSEPDVQSQAHNDESGATGLSAFTHSNKDSPPKDSKTYAANAASGSPPEASEEELATRKAQELAQTQAKQATDALYNRIHKELGWRMSHDQFSFCLDQFTTMQTEDGCTWEELGDVISRMVATLPKMNAGLSVYYPSKAFQDVRNAKAAERREAPDGKDEAYARRVEGYDWLFGEKPGTDWKPKTRADALHGEHEGRVQMLVERYMRELDEREDGEDLNSALIRAQASFGANARAIIDAPWIDTGYATEIVGEARDKINEELDKIRESGVEGVA